MKKYMGLDSLLKILQTKSITDTAMSNQNIKNIQTPVLPGATNSVPANRHLLGKVSIQRNPDGGLQVTVKSDANLWAFLRRETGEKYDFAGVPCFIPKANSLPGVRASFSPEEQNYEVGEYPNLAMILACNINEGVTFKFGAFPVSDQKLQEWANLFDEQLKALYLGYVKPVDITVEITAQTVQRELHY